MSRPAFAGAVIGDAVSAPPSEIPADTVRGPTYFAYGSNLHLPRLEGRVPRVELIGPARLEGFSLAWNKRGTDGSAKCNIAADRSPGALVLGALVRVCESGLAALDEIERGYRRVRVRPVVEDRSLDAWTYVANDDAVDPELLPQEWYRTLVVRGAEALGFPESYVTPLRRLSTLPGGEGQAGGGRAPASTHPG